jgi:hypothetical protein
MEGSLSCKLLRWIPRETTGQVTCPSKTQTS